MGRQILTKRAGADDDVADADVEDITSLYKNVEGVVTRPTKQQADGCFNSLFSNSDKLHSRGPAKFPAWPFTANQSVDWSVNGCLLADVPPMTHLPNQLSCKSILVPHLALCH